MQYSTLINQPVRFSHCHCDIAITDKRIIPVKWVYVTSVSVGTTCCVYICQDSRQYDTLASSRAADLADFFSFSLGNRAEQRYWESWGWHYPRCVSATRPRNVSGSCQVWPRTVKLSDVLLYFSFLLRVQVHTGSASANFLSLPFTCLEERASQLSQIVKHKHGWRVARAKP